MIDKLELHDSIQIASTNRYFRSIVKSPTHEDLLLAETKSWAKDRQLFACSACATFRRYTRFSDDMRKGKRTRGEVNAAARKCLRCGVIIGLYAPGTIVVIDGQPHVLRRICGMQVFTDRPTCQANCTECSPVALKTSTNSPYANHGQNTRRCTTRRVERLFDDNNTHEYEYYGIGRVNHDNVEE